MTRKLYQKTKRPPCIVQSGLVFVSIKYRNLLYLTISLPNGPSYSKKPLPVLTPSQPARTI